MMQWNRMAPWLLVVAIVAALLIAFGAPFASLLPFAVALACPLMMVFMMRGMAGMHGRSDATGGVDRSSPTR